MGSGRPWTDAAAAAILSGRRPGRRSGRRRIVTEES
jgi:hypothetical protein